MSVRRTLSLLGVLLAIGAPLSACGGGTPSATRTSTPANTFVVDEWYVVPPSGALVAGQVPVTATNKGKETHELVIVRAGDVTSLPTKADGSVDEDKIPEAQKAGEITDVAAGQSTTQTFDLPTGDYVAFCNIVDDMGMNGMASGGMGMGDAPTHVHYQLGMVNHFTVT